jgi:hypothetical protein
MPRAGFVEAISDYSTAETPRLGEDNGNLTADEAENAD